MERVKVIGKIQLAELSSKKKAVAKCDCCSKIVVQLLGELCVRCYNDKINIDSINTYSRLESSVRVQSTR
jgi:hypothetical protein